MRNSIFSPGDGQTGDGNIPAELREREQWVLWRTELRHAGEPTKKPYQVNGRLAKSDSPETWASFNSTRRRFAQGGYIGVGFVFARDDPYVGIDLDGCRDPVTGLMEKWAAIILEKFASTYAEGSPSKSGVKIFARGLWTHGGRNLKLDFPGVGDKKAGIEVYSERRFFAVTGQRLERHPTAIADCQAAIDGLWQEWFANPKRQLKPEAERRNSCAASARDSVWRYLSKLPNAISGSGGHSATFRAACECWRWSKYESDAWALLDWFNANKCKPEWSEVELRHKLDDAGRKVEAAGEIGMRLRDRNGGRRSRGKAVAGNGERLELPTIEVGPDEHRVTDEAIAALATGADIYARGGSLCELRETPEPPPGILRPDGGIRAVPLPEPRLRELLAAAAVFVRQGKKDTSRVPVPRVTVEQVAARGVWPGVRPLEGIVNSPQFLADGSILGDAGYDARSGLFLRADCKFFAVPQRPTGEQVRDCLAALLEVVADFPLSEIGKAGWLAAVLTAVARYAIDGPTPLIAIDAPVRGSGKSLLADAVGVIATGCRLPRATAATDDAEMRKRITATLLAGEPLALLDNVTSALGGASLDAVLTATTWTDRVLGSSTMTTALPARTIWFTTGNNIAFDGDTARRTLLIKIDCKAEHPEERSDFRHPDLLAWLRAERGRLAAAAATLLRAWHVAGRPSMGLPAWGSYEGWSAIIRAAVTWVGLPDPGEARQAVRDESDGDTRLLRHILAAWSEADPCGHGLTISDAIARAKAGDVGLAALFAEFPTDRAGNLNARAIGGRFHHLRGRVCGGKCLEGRDTNQGRAWRVCSVGGSDSKDSSDSNHHSYTREEKTQYMAGARNTVTTPPTVTGCNHCDPWTWRHRDGKAYCPSCGKYMGHVAESPASAEIRF